jgi:DNA-binding LacI/PurR family transcriptional regulator
VMIGRNADPAALDFADTDFDQCARLAVDHLVGLGHRHLGFVNLNASAIRAGRGNAIRLRDGIVGAAAAARARLTALTCESSIGGGRRALAELVERDPVLTAVIAFNEQAVAGILSEAGDRGLRIPGDLSILSIDMPAQAALMTTPTMTTVGPTAAAMGRAAAAMLIERVEGGPAGVTQMLFDGELVLRESTGPVPVRTPPDHDTA